MTLTYAEANALQKGLRRLGASGPGSWLLAPVLYRIDKLVYELTRRRHTLTSLLAGLPVVMLTTTGARSGIPRTVPVLGVPTTEGLVVVASSYGQARHPGWYHNLRADPRATGDQRARIWEQGLKVYPGWSQYERRASHRDIGVFVLVPVA